MKSPLLANSSIWFAVWLVVVDNYTMTTPNGPEPTKKAAEETAPDTLKRSAVPNVPDGGINDGKAALAVLVLVIALIVFAVVKL